MHFSYSALGKTRKVSQSSDDFVGNRDRRIPSRKRPALKGVQVTAAARLHLGFLDLAGDLGRQFGSIGLAIDAFETRIELREAPSFEVLGEERERGARLARRIAESLGLDTSKRLVISNAIPPHAGLGSGTQLALAIATAFRCLAGLPLEAREDARLLDRGARSGVGVALFERGGLAVDAGRGSSTEIPPVVAWVNFPRDWRILLILDPRVEGAHGAAETRAFARLPPFPADAASDICRRTLMQVLPGAAEADLEAFGEGVAKISGNGRRSFRTGSGRRSLHQQAGQQGRRAIEGSRGAWHRPELLGTDRLCLCIRPRPCGIPRSARPRRVRIGGGDQNLQRAASRRRNPRGRGRLSPMIAREEQWPRTSCT